MAAQHHCPPCRFLIVRYPEATGIVAEGLRAFGNELGKESAGEEVLAVYSVLGTIGKDILLGRVAVEVQKHKGSKLPCDRPDESYLVEQLRVVKVTVQVSSQQSGPEVASDDSIGIDHRYYLEYNFVP